MCSGTRERIEISNPGGLYRTHGFELLQWEQMVLQYMEKHGEISRAEVAQLCHLSGPQAYRLLKKPPEDSYNL
jgi:ATP-dependent DNA helicase RecG